MLIYVVTMGGVGNLGSQFLAVVANGLLLILFYQETAVIPKI